MPADERSVNFAEVVVEAAPAAEEPSMMQRLGSLGGSLKNMIAGAPAAADAADPNDEEQREESSTVSPLNTTVAPLREATAMKEASERHILPDEEPVNLHSEAPFCNYVMVRMSIGFLVLWLAGAALIVGLRLNYLLTTKLPIGEIKFADEPSVCSDPLSPCTKEQHEANCMWEVNGGFRFDQMGLAVFEVNAFKCPADEAAAYPYNLTHGDPVFYDLPTGPGTISATQISTRRLLDFSGKTIFADVTPARSDAGSGGLVNGLFLYRGASEGFYFQQEVDFEWVWGLRSSFEETDGALQLNVWNPDQNPVQISNKDFTAKGGDFFKRQTVQVQVQTDVVDFSIESDLPQHHGMQLARYVLDGDYSDGAVYAGEKVEPTNLRDGKLPTEPMKLVLNLWPSENFGTDDGKVPYKIPSDKAASVFQVHSIELDLADGKGRRQVQSPCSTACREYRDFLATEYETKERSAEAGAAPWVMFGLMMALLLSVALYILVKFLGWRSGRAKRRGAALRLAAVRGDMEALEELGASPEFEVDHGSFGFTALHAASSAGQAGAVDWLLSRGANTALVKDDEWNMSPAHYAAGNGHVAVLEVLLGHEPDLRNAQDFAGLTPLQKAEHEGTKGAVKFLTKFDELWAAASIEAKAYPMAVAMEAATFAGDGVAPDGAPPGQLADSADELLARGFNGYGTEGTELLPAHWKFRTLLVLWAGTATWYMIWRALFTISAFPTSVCTIFYPLPPECAVSIESPAFYLTLSIVFYICELGLYINGLAILVEAWQPVQRPERDLKTMLKEEDFPMVDVFIPTYKEELEVVEPTISAVLGCDYPKSKLRVHVLDDGKRAEALEMVGVLNAHRKFRKDQPEVFYHGRTKVKGVTHHAKAGNINSALLSDGNAYDGDFVLVLDCDMVIEARDLPCQHTPTT